MADWWCRRRSRHRPGLRVAADRQHVVDGHVVGHPGVVRETGADDAVAAVVDHSVGPRIKADGVGAVAVVDEHVLDRRRVAVGQRPQRGNEIAVAQLPLELVGVRGRVREERTGDAVYVNEVLHSVGRSVPKNHLPSDR